MLSGLVNQTSAVLVGGVVPGWLGNAHLSLFPYEPLTTGAGELVVIAANDGQFRWLAIAIGTPELLETPASARWVSAMPTATSCARCCWPGSPRGRHRSGSPSWRLPASRATRSTRLDPRGAERPQG